MTIPLKGVYPWCNTLDGAGHPSYGHQDQERQAQIDTATCSAMGVGFGWRCLPSRRTGSSGGTGTSCGGKAGLYAAGEYCAAPYGETAEQAEARRAAGRLTLAEARAERERWRARWCEAATQ